MIFMSNILKICCITALAVALILPHSSLSRADQQPAAKESPVLEVSIKDVVSNPGEYNGKRVSLEGKVAKVDYRNSSKGEPFTIFKLKDPENNEVGVYFEDQRLPLSKGDRVKIVGRFWKEKSYFLYKIKNVIKARTVDVI
jgi:hypothetical protein